MQLNTEKIIFWGDSRIGCYNYLIEKDSFNIATFECSVITNHSKKQEKAYNLSFDPSLLSEITSYGYQCYSLANNHSMDGGNESFELLVEYFKKNNIYIIGTRQSPFIDIFLNNKKVRIIAALKDASNYSERLIDIKQLIKDAQILRKNCDFLIGYLHFNYNAEYITTPEPYAVYISKKLIDNGFDCVIGSHPHVPQIAEQYKGKIIFYSLGNASYYISEGDKYLLSRIGCLVEFSKPFNINYSGFHIENGNPINKIKIDLFPEKNITSKWYYPAFFYYFASEIYIIKNLKAFLKRIKLFGIKHAIKFVLWLIFPKTLPFLLFFIPSRLSGTKKMEKLIKLE